MIPSISNLPTTRKAVEEILPHRYPMLFIDRALSISENHIQIEADISVDAPFFQGHFPGLPIMPGVLVVETMAQAGAMLVGLTRDLGEDKFLALASVEETKFRRSVFPNDTLLVDVDIVKIRGRFYKFKAKAHVGDQLVATSSFTASTVSFSQD